MSYKTVISQLLGLLVALSLTGCGETAFVPNPNYASNLKGLTLEQVKERSRDEVEEFKLKIEFKYKRKSGKEIVVDQYPFAENKMKNNGTIQVQMADEEFQNAVDTASSQIQRAKENIKECKALGIDVSDLGSSIIKAQSLYHNAKTWDELVGQANSATFFANTVINACGQRMAEFTAQKAAEETK